MGEQAVLEFLFKWAIPFCLNAMLAVFNAYFAVKLSNFRYSIMEEVRKELREFVPRESCNLIHKLVDARIDKIDDECKPL